MALRVGPSGVEREELLGEDRDGLADSLLRPEPVGAPEPRQRRVLAAGVAGDAGDLLDRDEDPVAGGERELEVVAVVARCRCSGGASARSGRCRGRCGRRGRPGVRRSRMSRGTTRRSALGRRTRTVPKSSRSVTRTSPSGPPDEAAVQAPLDEGDRSRRRGLADASSTPAGWPASPSSSASRAAWSDAMTTRAPSARQPSIARPIRAVRPAAGPARASRRGRPSEAATRHRGLGRRVGLPRQLERPGREESRLPVARRQVRRMASPPAARRRRRAPPVARRPGATGTRRRRRSRPARRRRGARPARGDRARWPGTRRRPDLGRVTDVEGPAPRRSAVPCAAVDLGPPRTGRGPRPDAPPSRAAEAPEPSADHRRPARRPEELGRRQQHDLVDRADRPLVGRIEEPDRVDLVAEQLDPDRELSRWREEVDEAAAAGHLAAPGDLEDRLVAQRRGARRRKVLVEPRPAPEAARLGRQIVGRDRGLEERLDARHEHAGPAAPPGRRAWRRGQRTRRGSARSARRRARSAAPAPPPRPGRRARHRARRRHGRRSRRRGRSSRPVPAPSTSAATRNDFAPWGTAVTAAWRPRGPAPIGRPRPIGPSRSWRLANAPLDARRAAGPRGRAGVVRPEVPPSGADAARRAGRAASACSASRATATSASALGSIEVDLRLLGGGRPTRFPLQGDLLRQPALADAPARYRSVIVVVRSPVALRPADAGASRSSSAGCPSGRAVRRPRPGGAAARSAGRSWNALKRLAALLVPSRAHASTASAAASSELVESLPLLGRGRSRGRGRRRPDPARRSRSGGG